MRLFGSLLKRESQAPSNLLEFKAPEELLAADADLQSGRMTRENAEEWLLAFEDDWNKVTSSTWAGYQRGFHPVEVAGEAIVKSTVLWGAEEHDIYDCKPARVSGMLGSLAIVDAQRPMIIAELHSTEMDRPREVAFVALTDMIEQSGVPTVFTADLNSRV